MVIEFPSLIKFKNKVTEKKFLGFFGFAQNEN
jgi:hypothetical protein